MKYLKTNEDLHGYLDSNKSEPALQPKVKHLIEYLSKLDPEMLVYLDHDGWLADDAKTEVEIIENRGLFDIFRGRLTINN